MSILRRGDEKLHYSDQSHRWIAPPDLTQAQWEAGMRAHLGRHLSTMGGPVEPDVLWDCRRPYIPRQRDRESADRADRADREADTRGLRGLRRADPPISGARMTRLPPAA